MRFKNLCRLGTILVLLCAGCAHVTARPVEQNRPVQFVLHAPNAKSVSVAGSFNHWDTTMHALSGPDRKGMWSTALALPAGHYEYLYFVDSTTWLADPLAPLVDNGMGGKNSFLEVMD